MENVKNLLSVNGGRDFAKVLLEMDEAGYDVEWQIINSSWVVPQNRERVFIIGHKRGRRTRRVFPLTSEEIGVEREYGVLKDALELVVDEKYNLSQEKLNQIKYFKDKFEINPNKVNAIANVSPTGYGRQNIISEEGIVPTLTAGLTKQSMRIATKVDRAFDARKHGLFGRNNEVIGTEGVSPTLLTSTGGGHIPNILIKNATKEGYVVANDGDGIDFSYPNSNTRRGRVQKEKSHTLTTGGDIGTAVKDKFDKLLIRRLTPRECWRLQGFTDEQFDKAQAAGLSDTQLYKQAGNAVTVPVIKKIAEKFEVKN